MPALCVLFALAGLVCVSGSTGLMCISVSTGAVCVIFSFPWRLSAPPGYGGSPVQTCSGHLRSVVREHCLGITADVGGYRGTHFIAPFLVQLSSARLAHFIRLEPISLFSFAYPLGSSPS